MTALPPFVDPPLTPPAAAPPWSAAAPPCSAMILAAGHGMRLRPLTSGRAKVVVPFLNRPLLDYTLDWLRRRGFRNVVINLHHCPDTVREVYGEEAFGLRLSYSVEKTLLGTAGGPRAVVDRLGDRVLIVNGDIATTIQPGPLLAHHQSTGARATLALHAGDAAVDYPGISVDGDGRVTRIPGVGAGASEEPGVTLGCFTGIHVVERSVLERAPAGEPCGMVDPIYAGLIDEGLSLQAVLVPGAWYEIGTPARYLEGQLEALRREDFPLAFEGYRRVAKGAYVRGRASWMRAGLGAPFLIDEGVHVEEGAAVRGVVAGRRVRIGNGATVIDSVLLAGAWVGTGARLERCVVLEDARVAPGARLADQVVEAAVPTARA